MVAHAEQPISMSEVAAACGCSRTKLFQAFRQQRRWTPLQFLARHRMESAHRRLLSPTQATNVTAVALDSDYTNLSRFAQHYRRLSGETP